MATLPEFSSETAPSDRDLLTQFAATRDEASFRFVVARHSGLVWAVCRQMLPCQQDREDVFQAAFLKLLMHADRETWHDAVGGWLHKVTYRLCLKVCAARSRQQSLASIEEPWAEENRLEAIQRQDAERALHEAISQLPRRDRQAIVLHYFQNKSQEEVAAEMGCTLPALKGLLQRSRRKLYVRLGCRGLSCSLALVALEQTLNAAAPVLPEIIEKTVLVVFNSPVGGGTVPSSPQVEELCRGEYMSMFQNGLVSKSAVILSSTTLFCLGTGGLISGIYQGNTAHASPVIAHQQTVTFEASEAPHLAQKQPLNAKEQPAPPGGQAPKPTPKSKSGERKQKIWDALNQTTTMEFVDMPLLDVVDYLRELHNIPINIDVHALEQASLATNVPLTGNLKEISLADGLEKILRQHDLAFCPDGEVLLITTQQRANAKHSVRIFDVKGFPKTSHELVKIIVSVVGPRSWLHSTEPDWEANSGAKQAMPPSYGYGTIAAYGDTKIIVSQSYRVLKEIEDLLEQLRETEYDDASQLILPGKDTIIEGYAPPMPKGLMPKELLEGNEPTVKDPFRKSAPENRSLFRKSDRGQAPPEERIQNPFGR